jgi:hypothetical protein
MKNLYKALAAFQQEVPAIHQGTKGYGYTYADLKTIFKVINPILKKHKLGFTQLLEDASIKTIVFHTESGESIESITPIPQDIALKGMNSYQVAGSGITYFRRYSLSSILTLVTDVDSDATGEEKPAPPTKAALNKERFLKAIEAIKTGDFTIEGLQEKYELTETQNNQLNKIKA